MMCLGFTKSNQCGRQDQVVAPNSVCPDITWFYLGAAAAIALALMGRGGSKSGGGSAGELA
jgi:hypothetical protein